MAQNHFLFFKTLDNSIKSKAYKDKQSITRKWNINMSDENSDETKSSSATKDMSITKYILYLLKRYWWLYVLWWIFKLTLLGSLTKWLITTMGCE